MCSILWSNPWGNDNSHASPQYGPNIYTGFRSTAKRKKKFPVLVRSPLPLVYQSGEFLCFPLVFFFGHLILGSTSLGSVQNHMTFAWHRQCRIVQGNARSVYFVRFVNSSSESRPKCWPFLLRCSLWLLSTRRDPYHAVSSNILFYFFLFYPSYIVCASINAKLIVFLLTCEWSTHIYRGAQLVSKSLVSIGMGMPQVVSWKLASLGLHQIIPGAKLSMTQR